MAHVLFTPKSGDFRFWADDSHGYGDPYDWCGGVVFRAPDEIEIGPYEKKITPSVWKAIIRECQRLGVKRILATTYPDGRRGEKRLRWIDVKAPSDPIQEFYRHGFDEE